MIQHPSSLYCALPSCVTSTGFLIAWHSNTPIRVCDVQAINEWGMWSGHWGPSSHHSPDIPLTVHAWVLSSFLMSNLNSSGTTLVCTQCYGFGGANFSWWPEDKTDVGQAIELPQRTSSGVWSRSYEKALVFCNPGKDTQGISPPVAIKLPTGHTYREALGQSALLSADGAILTLAINQSAVLVW
jgi:hypothetical protein